MTDRKWDNSVTEALADCLLDRDNPEAAEWLHDHENDDQVWYDLIGPVLDSIEEIAHQAEMTEAINTAKRRLVRIVSLSGDDYETAVDEINDNGGSTSAAVEYLSQWDYGDENDNAAPTNGYVDQTWLEKFAHHVVEHNNITYWLIANHDLGDYTLYRKPLHTND